MHVSDLFARARLAGRAFYLEHFLDYLRPRWRSQQILQHRSKGSLAVRLKLPPAPANQSAGHWGGSMRGDYMSPTHRGGVNVNKAWVGQASTSSWWQVFSALINPGGALLRTSPPVPFCPDDARSGKRTLHRVTEAESERGGGGISGSPLVPGNRIFSRRPVVSNVRVNKR